MPRIEMVADPKSVKSKASICITLPISGECGILKIEYGINTSENPPFGGFSVLILTIQLFTTHALRYPREAFL